MTRRNGTLAALLLAGCGAGDATVARPSTSASAAPVASPTAPEDPSLAAVQGKTVAVGDPARPLRMTPRATTMIAEMAEDAPDGRRVHVRLYRRCAIDVLFDPSMPSDRHIAAGAIRIVGDALSLAFLSGAEIDFLDGAHGAGFRFERPRDAPTCESAGWADVLDELDDRVAMCVAACRDDACRTMCWCVRGAEANHVACASASSADPTACAGALATERALCVVDADMTPLEAR